MLNAERSGKQQVKQNLLQRCTSKLFLWSYLPKYILKRCTLLINLVLGIILQKVGGNSINYERGNSQRKRNVVRRLQRQSEPRKAGRKNARQTGSDKMRQTWESAKGGFKSGKWSFQTENNDDDEEEQLFKKFWRGHFVKTSFWTLVMFWRKGKKI